MISSLQIGKLAPNFITVGVYKNRLGKIKLSDYQGKKYVILFFYPANFASVTQTELSNLNQKISEFQKLSTQILAISIDSPFSHLHFLLLYQNKKEFEQLKYPLVSDLNQKISKKYGLLTQEGFALPGLFIVDKAGIIQYYTANNLLCGRSINELIHILKSIQYVKKYNGPSYPIDCNFSEDDLDSHSLMSKTFFTNLSSQKKNLCQN